MKFTKVRLNGLTVVDLPIEGALPSDKYILKGIDGAGPPDLDVALGDTLFGDAVFQGRQAQGRELVGLVGLNPDFGSSETAADLRANLYGMITPGYGESIVVQFMNVDTVVAETTGYVRRLEINPFSKDPEVQLTIACIERQLVAPDVIFLEPASKSDPEILNEGTAPAGFHMELSLTSAESLWSLTDIFGTYEMTFVYDFEVGDLLEIDTRPGHRGVWVTRSAVRKNIIWTMTPESVWFMLHGGNNVFQTSSDLFNWGDVYYQPRFWGI